MSDRKLLRLAARSSGIEGEFENDGSDAGLFLYDPSNPSVWKRWNPLKDDGDAMRLLAACSLRLGINKADKSGWVEDYEGRNYHSISWAGIDPMPAIRRTIVIAAAKTPPLNA